MLQNCLGPPATCPEGEVVGVMGAGRLHQAHAASGVEGSNCSTQWLMAHRSQAEQSCCCPAGPVSKIRLLGDYHHATRIAFIEFDKAESAKVALNCSGALLGARGCPQHCMWLAAGSSACRHVFSTGAAVFGGGSCESLPACSRLAVKLKFIFVQGTWLHLSVSAGLYALAPLGS